MGLKDDTLLSSFIFFVNSTCQSFCEHSFRIFGTPISLGGCSPSEPEIPKMITKTFGAPLRSEDWVCEIFRFFFLFFFVSMIFYSASDRCFVLNCPQAAIISLPRGHLTGALKKKKKEKNELRDISI